jgi:plastocyanin
MTARRACLAALASTMLLALAPEAGPTEAAPRAGATTHAVAAAAPAQATARKRARARRSRWRVASSAFRAVGPGTLLGSSATAPGGGSTSAPGGGATGDPQPGGGSGPAQPPPVYHALSVASREFSLTLSRQLLTPGTETIQLNNRGEDPHNLVIAPENGSGGPIATYPDVASRETHTEQVVLPAGRYKLWCSLPGHEALGMRATVRVE